MQARAVLAFVSLALGACTAPASFDRGELIRETADAVIVPGYAAAATRAWTPHDRARTL